MVWLQRYHYKYLRTVRKSRTPQGHAALWEPNLHPSSKTKSNSNKGRRPQNRQLPSGRSLVALAIAQHGLGAVPRGLGMLVPDAAVVRLPYVHREALFSHNTDAWKVGNAVNVRVNNAFEPINATHQPYGWDQAAALYRRYKVIGFRLHVTAYNTQDIQPAHLLIRPVPVNENKTIDSVYLETCLEWPGVIDAPIPAAGGPIVSRTLDVDIPKLLGLSAEQYLADTSRYSADVSGAPQYAYVQVGVAGPSATSFADVTMRVEYIVQFWQRVTQNQS